MTHRPYTPWLFLAPGLAVCLLFIIFPFLNMIVLAFTDASALGGGQFTGVDNFVRMAQDPKFWAAARNSALYMVGVVPPLVLLPLLIAMLAQKIVPGIGIFRTAPYSYSLNRLSAVPEAPAIVSTCRVRGPQSIARGRVRHVAAAR